MHMKGMAARKEEPETINVWELMSGLDDGETSSPKSMAFPAIPVQKHMPVSPAVASKLSLDSFTLEPSAEKPTLPRQHLPRNVDKRYARSSVLALEDPVTHVQASTMSGNSFISSTSASSLFGSVSGSSSSSSFEAQTDNLQRSLSFKLAFNNHNKSMLGIEDTPTSNPSEDEFPNRVQQGLQSAQQGLQSAHRLSEDSSTPVSSIDSGSVFSASSLWKRWFKPNTVVVKAQSVPTRGESKPEGNFRKLSTQSNVLPPLPSIPSGNVMDIGPDKLVSKSRSPSTSDSDSSRDEFSEVSGQSMHKLGSAEQKRGTEVGHGHPVRRYRHSFSNGNQSRGSTEGSIPATMNRPSSWELEKVVGDSAFKAVLYSTNVRTDINAYEDSNAVRAILISLVGAAFDEKCLSQNPEYEQELKNALNLPVVAVPTVCVRGKYIAGIDNIMQFFKKGILGSLLLQTLPHGLKPSTTCICRGGKFLICPICKGKRRITRQGEDPVSCRHCVGTGLLKCPSCPK